MNIGEILIWEATNGLLLIPVVIGLVGGPFSLIGIGSFSPAIHGEGSLASRLKPWDSTAKSFL
jgi:hypothetical protein